MGLTARITSKPTTLVIKEKPKTSLASLPAQHGMLHAPSSFSCSTHVRNSIHFNSFKFFALSFQSPFHLSLAVLVRYRFPIFIQSWVCYTTLFELHSQAARLPRCYQGSFGQDHVPTRSPQGFNLLCRGLSAHLHLLRTAPRLACTPITPHLADTF